MYNQDLSYGLLLSDKQLDFLFNYPQGFDRMKCFATFLRMAVKEPTHYEKKEYSADLTPGQFAISEVELAKLWKCNRKTASKMVDLFHEMGLVSSVPNCRTTIFTVHCVASWYIDNLEIRNKHYSRHQQVEQRIKVNHNKLSIPPEMLTSLPSLSSKESDESRIAQQVDGENTESRDDYTSIHDDDIPNASDEENVREEELSNDSGSMTPKNGDIASKPVSLPDTGNNSDSAMDSPLSLPDSIDNSQADVTAVTAIETENDEAR